MAKGHVLYESTPGLIRTTIEAHGAGLRLFAQKEQNDIVRGSMAAGGEIWISVFLPKRFDVDYERAIGYNPRASWCEYKRLMVGKPVKFSGNIGNVLAPQDRPFVLTGNFMTAALGGARANAVATKARALVRVKIPTAHAMRPETLAVFKTLPSIEIKRVAQEVRKALIAGIGGKLNDRMAPALAGPGRPGLNGASEPAARSSFGSAA